MDQSPPSAAPEPVRQPAQGEHSTGDAINYDIACRKCGFNLRGLSRVGNCPECGTSIADTLRGDWLAIADPKYVRSLYRGTTLILLSACLLTGLIIVSILLSGALHPVSDAPEVVANILSLPIYILFLYGFWLLSASERTRPVRMSQFHRDPRPWLRAAIIAMAATTLGITAYSLSPVDDPGLEALFIAALIVNGIALLVFYFSSMARMRQLAIGLDDRAFVRQITTFSWMLPLVVLAGVIIFFGPIIAAIMYFLVVNRLRMGLKRIQLSEPSGN